MKKGYPAFLLISATLLAVVLLPNQTAAQQYKLKQVTNMMGMKSESTIYVKGMRKRTEGGGFSGMLNNLVTIEQCDLQRTVTINDRKKLYYIDPFAIENEVVEEDGKPAKVKPTSNQVKTTPQKGGVITIYYNITDTGERKKMFGMTARHVWTTQKMMPSADACTMKDSTVIKTDGWYIDLPQFNCPVRFTATNSMASGSQPMNCKDKYITKQSGKGKLGFPLIEKRTMIMGNAAAQASQFETDLETLEFSTAKLDSMLFEIPPGYTMAKSLDDLQDKIDAASIREMYSQQGKGVTNQTVDPASPKKTGVVRIGVVVPTDSESLQVNDLQVHMVNVLTGDKLEAISVASAEEAKKYNCDLLLTSKFTQVKRVSKIGGLLKAIKNADPNSASAYNIEAQLSLSSLDDGVTQKEKKISGKFEGSADVAAKKALEEGSRHLARELQ